MVQLWFRFQQKLKDACSRGHEFRPGSYRYAEAKGRRFRVCLACSRDRDRKAYEKRIKNGPSDEDLDRLALASLKREGYR